jgi:hypothetical protein
MSEFLNNRHDLEIQASSFECGPLAGHVRGFNEAWFAKHREGIYCGKPAVRLIGSIQPEHIVQIQRRSRQADQRVCRTWWS